MEKKRLFESKKLRPLTEGVKENKDIFKKKYLEGLMDMFGIKASDKVEDGYTIEQCVEALVDFVLEKKEDFKGLPIDDAVLYLNRAIKKKDSSANNEAQATANTVSKLTGIKTIVKLKEARNFKKGDEVQVKSNKQIGKVESVNKDATIINVSFGAGLKGEYEENQLRFTEAEQSSKTNDEQAKYLEKTLEKTLSSIPNMNNHYLSVDATQSGGRTNHGDHEMVLFSFAKFKTKEDWSYGNIHNDPAYCRFRIFYNAKGQLVCEMFGTLTWKPFENVGITKPPVFVGDEKQVLGKIKDLFTKIVKSIDKIQSAY